LTKHLAKFDLLGILKCQAATMITVFSAVHDVRNDPAR